MASVHEYPVTVEWQGGYDGAGAVTADRSGVVAALSVPPEFKGKGEGTNPEELLSAAVASCYGITFGIIAANRKLPVTRFTVKAVGEVESAGATHVYKRITLRPEILLGADATDEQLNMAEDMAHKADQYCIVTNAVRGKVEIAVEPTIARG